MYKARLKSWGCFKYLRKEVALNKTKASMLTIRSPDEFRIPEFIMTSLKDHVQHQITNNKNLRYNIAHVLLRPEFVFRHAIDEIIACVVREVLGQEKPIGESSGALLEKAVADFTLSMEMISYLLDKDEIDEAFSALRHIPGKIQRMLKEEPQHILQGLFYAIVKMNWDGNKVRSMNSVMLAVLKYTAAFATDPSLGWPPAHPLRRIFEGFTRLDPQVQLPEMTIRAWKYCMDTWESPPNAAVPNSTTSCTTHLQSITAPRRHARLDPVQHKGISVSDRLDFTKDDIL